jgi:hypothetical protein
MGSSNAAIRWRQHSLSEDCYAGEFLSAPDGTSHPMLKFMKELLAQLMKCLHIVVRVLSFPSIWLGFGMNHGAAWGPSM